MQTQTIKAELLINGKKVIVGHQFLEDIVNNIPDIKENKFLFDILALSDNPSVKENVSTKDNLSKKTIHRLLEDSNQEIIDNILSSSEVAEYIREDVLFKIIKTDNIKHLITIAKHIDNYKKCDLSKIIKKIAKHKNPLVRYSLLQWRTSDFITIKILKKLANDKDIDVRKDAKEELKRR